MLAKVGNFDKFANVLSNLPKEWKKEIVWHGGGEGSVKIQSPVSLMNPTKMGKLFKEGEHIAVVGFIGETPAFIIRKDYDGKVKGSIIKSDGGMDTISEKTFRGYTRYSGQPDYRIKTSFSFKGIVDLIPKFVKDPESTEPKEIEYKIFFFSVDKARQEKKKEREERKKGLTREYDSDKGNYTKKLVPDDNGQIISSASIAKYIKSKIGDELDNFAQQIKEDATNVVKQMMDIMETGQRNRSIDLDSFSKRLRDFYSKLSDIFDYTTSEGIRLSDFQEYVKAKQQLKIDPSDSNAQHKIKWNKVPKLLEKLRSIGNQSVTL